MPRGTGEKLGQSKPGVTVIPAGCGRDCVDDKWGAEARVVSVVAAEREIVSRRQTA